MTRDDEARRDGWVSRLVSSVLPLLLLGGLLTVLVRRAAEPVSNFDTYFHLRFGHEFLTDWSLTRPGSVSSFATNDWLPTQWLPQVVMARTEQLVGLPGIAWLFGLQLCALVVTFYLVGRQWADPLPTVVVTTVAVIAAGPSLSMRPQVLSYVFVTLTVAAWLRARERGRPPWPLVPLGWLWAMCHGMWPVGIVIGLVAVAAWALETRPAVRTLLVWLSVPVLALCAGGLTPVGPGLYAAVLEVNGRGEYFAEWQPVDFTAPPSLAFILLLVTALTVAMRFGRDWMFVGLVVLALGWAMYSARTMPVAASMLVPLTGGAVQSLLPGHRPLKGRERGVVLGAAAAALAALAALVPTTSEEPPPQPAWVDEELGALAPGTDVLNEWGWGGYLMWRYPHLDLVMHGYGDTFTDAELARNKAIGDLAPGWDRLVQRTGAELAVLPPDYPLTYALRKEGWRVLDRSEEVVMLSAPRGWSEDPP